MGKLNALLQRETAEETIKKLALLLDGVISAEEKSNMATIKERAWEKYPEVIHTFKHHNCTPIDINEEKRRMYIEIATEQKAIDDANLEKIVSSWKEEEEYWIKRNKKLIEKACKEFCCSCMRENDRSCICLDNSKCRLYKDFRKTMED